MAGSCKLLTFIHRPHLRLVLSSYIVHHSLRILHDRRRWPQWSDQCVQIAWCCPQPDGVLVRVLCSRKEVFYSLALGKPTFKCVYIHDSDNSFPTLAILTGKDRLRMFSHNLKRCRFVPNLSKCDSYAF